MDLWQDDADPINARIERRLTDVGSGYLYRVHGDVHAQLGLPALNPAQLHDWYRTPVLAKAVSDEQRRSGSKALQLFEELRGQTLGPKHARALAEAVTENWFAHGLVEDRARKEAMKGYLTGVIRGSGQVPPESPESLMRRSIADPGQAGAGRWAAEHAAEHMVRLRENTRRTIAGHVLDAVQAQESAGTLAIRLGTAFGTLNRDWRRVAITELALSRAHGYLSELPEGSQVEWRTAAGCCAVCAGLDGRRFTVRHAPGDWGSEVWPGKSNKGRAFSVRKRDGTQRAPEDRAAPCIPMHPNCRCRWVRVLTPVAGASARLEAYLEALALI